MLHLQQLRDHRLQLRVAALDLTARRQVLYDARAARFAVLLLLHGVPPWDEMAEPSRIRDARREGEEYGAVRGAAMREPGRGGHPGDPRQGPAPDGYGVGPRRGLRTP